MTTEIVKIKNLIPSPENARKHPQKQIEKLAAAIQKFGFLGCIVADGAGNILAGHARFEAAKLAGLEEVPVVLASHLTTAQKRAFMLADNRLAQEASWDTPKLKSALEFLNGDGLEISFTGFETAEIDLILGAETSVPADDEIPQLPSDYQPVTRESDIWTLGAHRVICGDSLLPETYKALMGEEKAQMVFTDPPYNVPIQGHVKKSKKAKAREFVQGSGELSESGFTDFLKNFLLSTAGVLQEGAILYVCMDAKHYYEILTAARQAQLVFMQLCVWAKDRAGMGTFYRSQHELMPVFKYGRKTPHINNFQLGQHGRHRTNIWSYPMVHESTQPDLEGIFHPTVKPIALVMDAIFDCSHRGGIILDAFGGSGTTLIAAEKAGRRARLIELDPLYCDMTIDRFLKLTGKQAVLEATGETFEQVRQQRQGGK